LVIAGITFAAGYAVTTIGTYELTVRGRGELDETYYSNLAPNVILMSISAFALLRHFGEWLQDRSSRFQLSIRCLTLASTVSFGAYLVHMIVVDTLGSGALGFAIGPMCGDTAWVVPTLSAVTLCGSLALATLMRQTRALRWLVP
jgi:surface polysaccharide O-acyltransferase-like enzyme